ncbi:MAG: hypothetical protein ACKVZH_11440 [Blastocatellia bacterium]
MPNQENIGEPTELATPQNANSPQISRSDNDTLQVICVNFADGVTYAGAKLKLKAQLKDPKSGLNLNDYNLSWGTDQGSFVVNEESRGKILSDAGDTVYLATNGITGCSNLTVTVKATHKKDSKLDLKPACLTITIREPETSDLKYNFDQKMDQLASNLQGLNSRLQSGVNVSLQRSAVSPTPDLPLWVVIRETTRGISFNNYLNFMDMVLCGDTMAPGSFGNGQAAFDNLRQRRFLPFNDTDAYRLLKTATEAFLLVNGGVGGAALRDFNFTNVDLSTIEGIQFGQIDLGAAWLQYLANINGDTNLTVPYLSFIRRRLADQPLIGQIFLNEEVLSSGTAGTCEGVLRNKLSQPFFIELIWSYWHEEGMLVQTMNALSRRFQNIRNPQGGRDPLAALEIDPLRPLNNLLWGHIQDEQHRLSVMRRAYEYDHHYGISIEGRAVPRLRPADSRSKFLEAFHQLLHLANTFFKQDDDTTVRADGFPILNALREVHLILSQGAHNQFGDLPSTARQEMLIQQYMLARPEFREFLPTRIMVAYPEPWMDRVDAMKTLQGWTDTSVLHFNYLAIYGEQLLLSIRYGNWNNPDTAAAQAGLWARFWRSQIQSYLHSYRAVTGVDLATPTRGSQVDSTPPSVHLRSRAARR